MMDLIVFWITNFNQMKGNDYNYDHHHHHHLWIVEKWCCYHAKYSVLENMFWSQCVRPYNSDNYNCLFYYSILILDYPHMKLYTNKQTDEKTFNIVVVKDNEKFQFGKWKTLLIIGKKYKLLTAKIINSIHNK